MPTKIGFDRYTTEQSRRKIYIQRDECLWLRLTVMKPSHSSAPFEKCYIDIV